VAKLTLDQKLIQIYKALDFIGKAGENKAQNYNYVRAADVVRGVRAALADNGIYAEINFDFVGAPYTIARSKDPNAPFSAVNVKCSIVLHDSESSETRTGSGLGAGADLGDKAIYKAQTGGLKYALRNTLLVPDEEGADPEADESVDRAAAEPAPKKIRTPEPVEAPPEEPEPAMPVRAKLPESEAPAAAQREPGDESEAGADDGTLPTEEEKNEYRVRFNKLVDNLSSTKNLSASKGLKVEKKFVVFLLQTVGAERTGDVTRVQWLDFLARAEALGAKDNGWATLANKINTANGIESKK
jgi:hypothetical protein